MSSLDCHFKFNTIIKAKGLNEEEVLKNLIEHIDKNIISEAKKNFSSGIEILKNDVIVKKERNLYEINLSWASLISLDTDNIPLAMCASTNILQGTLDPFKELIKESFKKSNFVLCKLVEPYITSVDIE